jgi:hypothetical protein
MNLASFILRKCKCFEVLRIMFGLERNEESGKINKGMQHYEKVCTRIRQFRNIILSMETVLKVKIPKSERKCPLISMYKFVTGTRPPGKSTEFFPCLLVYYVIITTRACYLHVIVINY